jgi:molybdopterin synthase sulfur carrier subunit
MIDPPADIETVADLRAWLAKGDPVLGEVLQTPSIRAAVDQAICISDTESVRGAREVAFMPPLSGG